MDEEAHEDDIAEERDEAVGEMESDELREWGRGGAAVAPGVVEVPKEVVEDGEFDGDGGGEEIVAGGSVGEEGERGELEGHA